MNFIKKLILTFSAIAIFLGGAFVPIQASAATEFPSETNSFGKDVYVKETNIDEPFFDVILPKIRENIKENNTHTLTPYYDKLPLANNPENFQGLGHTTYANINGKTVTAEAFYRFHDESLSDPNNGLGLLVFQCIEYKRAHPDEDVKITFSSYRTSATASVCVIPESKYYGYMRSLYTTDYDEHGFVRISYMLTEAARMGIEVTLVNHLNSYGVMQYNPATSKLKYRAALSMKTYFNSALKTKCYNSYAKGKKVSDFMKSVIVEWNVDDKTCDMQHVKSATVSHYLATDGTEHRSAVFLSSANLDENNYKGCNGNNSSQTGTIISDHDEVYRVTYNFTKLMTKYTGVDDMYYLRKFVNETNNKQIALIRSGREHEIPKDEQIVYLGSENDPVFEMYFTPFGGSADTWDTVKNPFAKYISKLPKSTDYVELFWNEFGYGKCHIGDVFEKMVEQAYCKNPNIRNKISIRATDFDTTEVQKLKVGREIGARNIMDGTNIHSKDILLSYEEDGVRHNVSLVTSCNFYMIAFNYRTNSLLVINETEESGGNYYDIAAEKYSYYMVNNDLMLDPGNLALKVGEQFTPTVKYSGTNELTWSIDKSDVASIENGTITALKSGTAVVTVTDGVLTTTLNLSVNKCIDCIYAEKLTFGTDEQYVMSKKLAGTPAAFRAKFNIKKSNLKSKNTILSCDNGFNPAYSVYINGNGNPCLMIRDTSSKTVQETYVFDTVNVATGKDVHLVFSYVGRPGKNYINCYVNGAYVARLYRTSSEPIKAFEETNNYVIGGDQLNGNATYFPGTIYSVAVWSDDRTQAENTAEYKTGVVDVSDENLLAAYNLEGCEKCLTTDLSLNSNNLERVVLWQNKEDVAPVGDYDYSFAVIGDTQTMCEKDPAAMESIYDWLVDNKDTQKIKYVMGLGDITDDSTDREWEDSNNFISKLNGKIPYSICRGNHDDWDDFNSVFHNGYYETSIDGVMNPDEIVLSDSSTVSGDITNSYRYLSVGGVDYLIMTLDFGLSEDVLQWADSVIEAHPNHKVIITTHAYMYRDGTTIDANDCYPPSYFTTYENALNGDEMWEKSFSKHKNIVMVLSGHDPWQHIVYRQDEGVNGNLVTQMLIDPQYVDNNIGSTAMVAMFYFSNNSKTLTVRYYSVAKDRYGSVASQFTIDLYNNEINDEQSQEQLDTPNQSVVPDKSNTQEEVAVVNPNQYVSGNKDNTNIPTTFTLSKSKYVYDGTTATPDVLVKDSNGVTLKNGTDYSVKYENGRKLPGKYTVTITCKGNYSGEKKLHFTISPKSVTNLTAKTTSTSATLEWKKSVGATSYKIYKYNTNAKKYDYFLTTTNTSYKISKLSNAVTYKYKIIAVTKDGEELSSNSAVIKATTKPKKPSLKVKSTKKGKVTLTWSNIKRESGYQVYYSSKKNGKYKKLGSYKTNVVKTTKKLKSNKKYYFKVRAYKTVSGKKVYSEWSAVKSIKIK